MPLCLVFKGMEISFVNGGLWLMQLVANATVLNVKLAGGFAAADTLCFPSLISWLRNHISKSTYFKSHICDFYGNSMWMILLNNLGTVIFIWSCSKMGHGRNEAMLWCLVMSCCYKSTAVLNFYGRILLWFIILSYANSLPVPSRLFAGLSGGEAAWATGSIWALDFASMVPRSKSTSNLWLYYLLY